MTELDKLGAQAAAKVRALGKIKDNLDQRSSLVAQELSQVWAALEAGQTVNDCKTKKEWANRWHISDRMCRYILRGRAKRTGEHRNRTVPIKQGLVVSIGKRKFKLVWIGDSSDSNVDEDGINNYGKMIGEYDCDVTLKMVEINPKPAKAAPKKKEKPAPKKEADCRAPLTPKERKAARRFAASFVKTHKMQPDGKRTWCGKTPGLTLAKTHPCSSTPTCKMCQNGEERAAKVAQLEMSEPAKALAAAADSAESPFSKLPPADRESMEKMSADLREGKPRWSACPDAEPEYESLDPRRHFPTDEEREQSELLNTCGNLDGDDEEAL